MTKLTKSINQPIISTFIIFLITNITFIKLEKRINTTSTKIIITYMNMKMFRSLNTYKISFFFTNKITKSTIKIFTFYKFTNKTTIFDNKFTISPLIRNSLHIFSFKFLCSNKITSTIIKLTKTSIFDKIISITTSIS